MSTSIHMWENEMFRIKNIASYLKQGKVLLVLGSGVSKPLNLPMWEELLLKMYEKRGKKLNSKISLGKAAKILRDSEFKKNEEDFRKEIQNVLYDGFNTGFEGLMTNSLLPSIGAMVMASQRGSSSRVITFNFDNVLELYLQYHGYTLNSCIVDKHWENNSDVHIYHPHGFIPAPPENPYNESQLIFDSLDFLTRIKNPVHPWNKKLTSLMASHFCIFIGLSGDDDSLTSLLLEANQNHVLTQNKSPYWGVCFQGSENEMTELNWGEHRVFVNQVDYKKNEIAKFLFSVCQKAANS